MISDFRMSATFLVQFTNLLIGKKRTLNHLKWLSSTYNLSLSVTIVIWLVVWTPLKHISQLGWLFLIYWTIKSVPNHQPVIIICLGNSICSSVFHPAPTRCKRLHSLRCLANSSHGSGPHMRMGGKRGSGRQVILQNHRKPMEKWWFHGIWNGIYPLAMTNIWKDPHVQWKSPLFLWSFSTVMLIYQRVDYPPSSSIFHHLDSLSIFIFSSSEPFTHLFGPSNACGSYPVTLVSTGLIHQ